MMLTFSRVAPLNEHPQTLSLLSRDGTLPPSPLDGCGRSGACAGSCPSAGADSCAASRLPSAGEAAPAEPGSTGGTEPREARSTTCRNSERRASHFPESFTVML